MSNPDIKEILERYLKYSKGEAFLFGKGTYSDKKYIWVQKVKQLFFNNTIFCFFGIFGDIVFLNNSFQHLQYNIQISHKNHSTNFFFLFISNRTRILMFQEKSLPIRETRSLHVIQRQTKSQLIPRIVI